MARAFRNQTKKRVSLFPWPMLQFQGKNGTIKTTCAPARQGNVSNSSFQDVPILCKQGRLKEALHILHVMDQLADNSAYVPLLQLCIQKKALSEGTLVHTHINETGTMPDTYLGNTLVNMYAKCGSLVDARRVFNGMPRRDAFSWNVMIAAYSKHGLAEAALTLFHQMQQTGIPPNHFTFASVLPACAKLTSLEQGTKMHEDISRSGVESHVVVDNALVDMYAKCGSIEKARHAFDKMHQRDVVSWTTMIAGYVRNGQGGEALKLFRQMQQADVKPDSKTYASVLPACANLAALEQGMGIHEEITRSGFQSDVFVESALVDMYAKCGSMENARHIFDKMHQRNVVAWTSMIAGYMRDGHVDEALELFREMPERDVVTWTAMIAGYVENGQGVEALKLFQQMQQAGVKPNLNTFASVLPACANLAALEQGMDVHEHIIRSGFQCDVFVESALVDMYAKCGSIKLARNLFDKMDERNVISWTAMIAGYAMHGYGKEALALFEQMQHVDMKPNHVTLVCVLSACCHAGLVEEGYQYFYRMNQHYHITPVMEHYVCMVDLLGRAGRLDEALEFINKMPIKPNATVWKSLLAACRIHTNIEVGEFVAECLIELDPKNAGPYVLLSNIYATVGRWDDSEKVRRMMKDRRVKKMPGCSWIEVNKQMHTFVVGDRSHPQTQKIYAKLESLYSQMKSAGYVPDTRFVLHDVEEEQKEQIIFHHSEKLAIAFGLINTSPNTTIRVIKNLRVCSDCHSAAKFISKIVAQEIVLRDANRYHHFKDGWCSCGDYW